MMYVEQILSLFEGLCLFQFHRGYKYFLVQCYSLGSPPPADYKTVTTFSDKPSDLAFVKSSGLCGLRISLCL